MEKMEAKDLQALRLFQRFQIEIQASKVLKFPKNKMKNRLSILKEKIILIQITTR